MEMMEGGIAWELALDKLSKPIEPTSKQGQALLGALRFGHRYTVGGAIVRLGIYALSQRVGELKKLGWPIKARFITLPNGKKVKEYWL